MLQLCFCSSSSLRFFGPPRSAGSLRRSRLGRIRACASNPLLDDYKPVEAIDAAKSGDFRAAARSLTLNISRASVSDPEKRRAIARDIFNPVTVEKIGKNNADDAGLVELYEAMKKSGVILSYGSAPVATLTASPQEKAVSVERLVSQADLPLEALTPKQSSRILWQLSGIGIVISIVLVTRQLGIESLTGPIILALGTGFFLDQSVLRGSIFETVYGAIFPEFRERILKHEAGHLLIGYLSGLSISGYVLSGREALQAKLPGIMGQGGTLFYDAQLNNELKRGQLTQKTVDQWTVVVMAGIAAEAIEYGRAEGGAGDESLLVSLLTSLKPPWNPERIKSQARWAVLQAIMMLRANHTAYLALVELMRERRPLGDCIECIERLCQPPQRENVSPVVASAMTASGAGMASENRQTYDPDVLAKREREIVAELARVKEKLDALEGSGK